MAKTKDSNKRKPEVIIFDVDGVLVDVRGSFHRTVLETVRWFTGRRVTHDELHRWKNRSGFNDDWTLSTAWVRSLGGTAEYDEVKLKFLTLYWGSDGKGNVMREKWLLPLTVLRRMSAGTELALFTGRVRREVNRTLDFAGVRKFFAQIVTADDVEKHKPDPEGLLKILRGRDPRRAIYIGDNVDDALAAQAAGVPFVAVVPTWLPSRRDRVDLLKKCGAQVVLKHVRELEQRLASAGQSKDEPRLRQSRRLISSRLQTRRVRPL